MKAVSPELAALFLTRQFYVADLYRISFLGGGADALYCSGDQDVSTGTGTNFSSGGGQGPYFDRQDNKALVRWKRGVEVDTMTLDVIPGVATIQGQPWLQAVRMGLFDGATLTLSRAFMATYGVMITGGVLTLFVGRIADCSAGRSVATFSINSHLELLNIQMPRNVYTPGCLNSLGDASCGANLAAFSAGGSAGGGSTSSVIVASDPSGSGAFNLGKVTFSTGALTGLSRSIRTWSGSAMSLLSPFPLAPAPGDAFTAFMGCDKTLGSNGCAKFSNQGAFRAFPFLPSPETAL